MKYPVMRGTLLGLYPIAAFVIVCISGLAAAEASGISEARVNTEFVSSINSSAIGATHPANVIDFHDRSANITASFTESASDVVWTVNSSSVFSINIFVGPAVRLSNVTIDIFNVTCYNLPSLEDSSKPLSVPACVSFISNSSNSQLSDVRLRFRSSFSNATLFSANLMSSMENTKISVTDMPLVYARHVENRNEKEYSVPAIVLNAPYTRSSNIGSGNEFVFSRINAKFATLKKRPWEFDPSVTLMDIRYSAGREPNVTAPPTFVISNFTNLDAEAGSNLNYNSLMIVTAHISFDGTHRCVLTVANFTDMGFQATGAYLYSGGLINIYGFKTFAPVPLARTGSKGMVHANVIDIITHVSSSAQLVISNNDFTIGGGNVKIGYPHGRYQVSYGGVILIRNNTGGQSANVSSGISINMVFIYGGKGYITDNTNFGTIDMYSDLALANRSSLTVSRNTGVSLIVVRGLLFYFDPNNGGTIDPASLSNEAASTLLIESNEVKAISVTSLDTTYGFIQLQKNVPPFSNNGNDTNPSLPGQQYPINIIARGGGVVSDLSNKGFTPNVVLRDFTGHYEVWCANCSSVMPNATNTTNSSAPTDDDFTVKNATITLVAGTSSLFSHASSSSFPLLSGAFPLPQRIQISWNAAPVFIVAPLNSSNISTKAIAKITEFACSNVSVMDSESIADSRRNNYDNVSVTRLNASVSCAPSSTLRRCDKDYWFFKGHNPPSHSNYRDEYVMREGVESCGEHQKDVPSGGQDDEDDRKHKWVISVAIAGAVIGVVVAAFIVKKIRSNRANEKAHAVDSAELGSSTDSDLLSSKPIQRYN